MNKKNVPEASNLTVYLDCTPDLFYQTNPPKQELIDYINEKLLRSTSEEIFKKYKGEVKNFKWKDQDPKNINYGVNGGEVIRFQLELHIFSPKELEELILSVIRDIKEKIRERYVLNLDKLQAAQLDEDKLKEEFIAGTLDAYRYLLNSNLINQDLPKRENKVDATKILL
jgi:hypothetical protein